MPAIIFVTSMKDRPGKEDETREVLSSLVVATHAEEGCILYALHQGAQDPNRFVLVERWESQKHLDAHDDSLHEAAVLARADELLAEPPDSVRYVAVPRGVATKGSLAGNAI